MDINDLVGGGKVVPIPALIKTIVSDGYKRKKKKVNASPSLTRPPNYK